MREELEGEVHVERNPGPYNHRFSLMDKIYIERGSAADWGELKALHYKTSAMGVGPLYFRCVIEHSPGVTEVIGIDILTVPKILDAGRNLVFPHMKPNQRGVDTGLMQSMRVMWLNRHMRLNARIVVDTMYRGVGVGYRLRNLAMRMCGFRFIEARSSMSRYNPFSFKSGSKMVTPKAASAQVQGLAMFARNFQAPAYDFIAILEELRLMPEYLRERTLEDMRDWYYRHSAMEKSGDKRLEGRSRIAKLEVNYLLRQIMQLTFGATIYSLFENPDFGRELPKRIPLTAFDNQAPNEPLNLDLI